MYNVEVKHLGGSHQNSTGSGLESSWQVCRRYSEFYALDRMLRAFYPDVSVVELPEKKNVLLRLTQEQVRREPVVRGGPVWIPGEAPLPVSSSLL